MWGRFSRNLGGGKDAGEIVTLYGPVTSRAGDRLIILKKRPGPPTAAIRDKARYSDAHALRDVDCRFVCQLIACSDFIIGS